jgi:hypothetical protein
VNLFSSPEKLKTHLEICETFDGQRVNYPKPGTFAKFGKYQAMTWVPFSIYADSECMMTDVENSDLEGKNIGEATRKRLKKLHEPISYRYYIVASEGIRFKPIFRKFAKTSEDHDISTEFMETLHEDCRKMMERYFRGPVPIRMTTEDSANFRCSAKCHFCEKQIYPGDEKNLKVRDHCHFTGKFRGAAHNKCNLN